MQRKPGQLFDNKILEALTRTHIAVPLTIFFGAASGIVLYSLYVGLIAPWANLWLFLGGFFFFTLVEYLVHRYTFHMEPNTPRKEKLAYTFHGVHHEFPRDRTRLAMPPLMSITLAVVFFLLYRLLMGNFGLPFAAGFMAGYATYLTVHYSVHAFRPPKNFLKVLWVHHAIHHYQDPNRAFGVSSPLWDVIFRTMPEKKAKFKVKSDKHIDDKGALVN